MRKLIAVVLLLCVVLLVSCRSEVDSGEIGGFREMDCPFDVPEGAPARRLTCGMVTIPERHESPDGATIEIAVAVFKAKNLFPQPDPLVLVEGGPGGSALTSLAPVFAVPEADFLYQKRDLVIIEQRGTFYSIPSLDCPDAPVPGLVDRALTGESLVAAHQACRDDLLAEGVALDAFNSVENAADIPLVVEALGYTEYDFMGLSYGTMLAQHVMRDHPEGLRSVIMDSVAPLSTNFLPNMGMTGDRAFRLLFDGCATDDFCATMYPDLETTFHETVAALDEAPVTVTVEASDGEEPFDVMVDGAFLTTFLFESLYNVELIPYLPGYITAVAGGDMTWIEAEGYELLLEPTFADGFFYTVLCAEDADFEPDATTLDGIHEELVTPVTGEWESFFALCEVWDVPALPDWVDEPVESDIPTLILNGEFDPITPPAYGDNVAETLVNGYSYTYPGASHGVIGAGECPIGMLLAFLDDPTVEPDSSCLDGMRVRFDVPLTSYVLKPVEIESVGVRMPIAVSWEAVEPGVFRPALAPDDREMRVLSVADDNPQRAAREYIIAQEPDGWDKFASETVEDREWHVFLMVEGTNLTIVGATVEGDTSYLVTFVAPEVLVGDLADYLYFPGLRGFEVIE